MSKLSKKVFSVALCAALVGGTAVALPAVAQDGSIVASAESDQVTPEATPESVEPSPDYPDPVEPEPVEPSPEEPDPVESYPIGPSPEEPDPVEPYPIGPSPEEPDPVEPSPDNLSGDFEYEVNDDNTVEITKCIRNIGDVVIPDSIDEKNVTSIDSSAFAYSAWLTSITIPESVTSIGKNPFSHCITLESINVNSKNTNYSSVDGVLFNKNETIIIACPIGKKGQYIIPKSVTIIGSHAFDDCIELTSITIPDSVTHIEDSAFFQCAGLTSITIPDSVTTIGDNVFSCCTSLTNITIPENITEIGSGAFYGCIKLTSITIPNSITSIGDMAFLGCTGLTGITIPDSVTKIGWDAFYGCTGLTSITIPDSVTTIGYSAFYGCDNLTIYGKKGSYAETYAKENNIEFVDPSILRNVSTITTTATVGEPITLNAIAEGGTAPYTYALMYKKSTSNTWLKIGTKYGTKSTGSFTPGKAVKYDIMINIKDATGKIKSKTFTVDVKAPLKNKTTVNADSVKTGQKIVLKGAASGGTAGYKYAFYYKKSKNSEWLELITPYTTKSIAFKPKSATSYDLKSVVKDADGRTTEKTFTVKVTK